MRDRAPVVYLGDDSPPVRAAIREKLRADGVVVYTPEATTDPTRETSTVGVFRCGILHLDHVSGEVDAIEMAALLRFYQSNLPVAFLHEKAPPGLLSRAHPVGPLFKVPEDLDLALAWARAHLK
jgi:hypothetical protein